MASGFGARLWRYREAKKLTLQQVADAVGCTKAYIWELEMKEGQRPSAERVRALAKELGVTMEMPWMSPSRRGIARPGEVTPKRAKAQADQGGGVPSAELGRIL